MNNLGQLMFNKLIKPSLDRDPELGVCILYKNDKYGMWFSTQCPLLSIVEHKLYEILSRNYYSDFEKDFIVIDRNGNVLYTNNKAVVATDINGFIHVDNDSYIVCVVNDPLRPRYLGYQNINKLNKSVKSLISKKKIKELDEFKSDKY